MIKIRVVRSIVACSRTGSLLATLAAVVAAGGAAWAHQDPAGCQTGVTVGLNIFRADGVTPAQGNQVTPCETLVFQATVSNPGKCAFQGGELFVLFPTRTCTTSGDCNDAAGGVCSNGACAYDVTPTGGIPCLGGTGASSSCPAGQTSADGNKISIQLSSNFACVDGSGNPVSCQTAGGMLPVQGRYGLVTSLGTCACINASGNVVSCGTGGAIPTCGLSHNNSSDTPNSAGGFIPGSVDVVPCAACEFCNANKCTDTAGTVVDCSLAPCTTVVSTNCVSRKGLCDAKDCGQSDQCTDRGCDPQTGQCFVTDTSGRCGSSDQCAMRGCNPASGCFETDTSGRCGSTDQCAMRGCNPASGCFETDTSGRCGSTDQCATRGCNPASGCFETDTSGRCGSTDQCATRGCNPASGCFETDTSGRCGSSDQCTTKGCNPASGCFETDTSGRCGTSDTCHVRGCDPATGCFARSPDPLPPECLPGCRITGGGIACDPSKNPNQCVAEIVRATFGGQVGAPCACIGCFDDFDHIQGSWTHNRKQAQGSFHAKDYNSLICGCDGDFTNGLCNPGNRPPGPEPRPAPANMACFSGIGDYAPAGGRRTLTVAFRVEVEDRSEPGGTNGTPPPDVYRIRIWIPNPTAGETANDLAAGACCTNASPTGQAARAPNIDDGGSLIRGNIQIHPQTPNSADGRCPIPSGRCTPSP